MLLFCPQCSNALTVKHGERGLQFACQTCSYAHNIDQKITSRVYHQLKEVDDVLGGKVRTAPNGGVGSRGQRPQMGPGAKPWQGFWDSASNLES